MYNSKYFNFLINRLIFWFSWRSWRSFYPNYEPPTKLDILITNFGKFSHCMFYWWWIRSFTTFCKHEYKAFIYVFSYWCIFLIKSLSGCVLCLGKKWFVNLCIVLWCDDLHSVPPSLDLGMHYMTIFSWLPQKSSDGFVVREQMKSCSYKSEYQWVRKCVHGVYVYGVVTNCFAVSFFHLGLPRQHLPSSHCLAFMRSYLSLQQMSRQQVFCAT